LQNRDFTYSNDTPIHLINVLEVASRGIYFLRRHTCLFKRFKHKVGERECEEGQRNDNDKHASEKEDKPMPVMAAQVVSPVNIQSTELTHLKATPDIME
jgi:hypothetical protein